MEDKKEVSEFEMCLACIGQGELYDTEEDSGISCSTCEGTGEATPQENEIFLSEEVNRD